MNGSTALGENVVHPGSGGTAVHCCAEQRRRGRGAGDQPDVQIGLHSKETSAFPECVAEPCRTGPALWRPLLWLSGSDATVGGSKSGNKGNMG